MSLFIRSPRLNNIGILIQKVDLLTSAGFLAAVAETKPPPSPGSVVGTFMLISNGLAAPDGASGVLVDMLVVGWFFAAPVGGASYSLYWALRSSASGD